MTMMTSAYANKLLKSLEEDKQFWLNRESDSCTYVASADEEPIIPEYDYKTVADTIDDIDCRISVIKHAINLNNATAVIAVGDTEMSVDTILVRMAQLNKRKGMLDYMRKLLPKMRTTNHSYSSHSLVAEYRYINFDPDLIKAEYEKISAQIMQMQIALDRYNQTVEFEVAV